MKKLKLNFYFALLVGIVILPLSSCEIINPDEGVPSYVHILPIDVEHVQGMNEGSLSSAITHVNVFIPDPVTNLTTSLGVLELPATIPILLEGDFEIKIDPVIKANGSSFSLQTYPFYQRLEVNRTLTPAVIDTLDLTTRYKSGTQFAFNENFESGNPSFFTRSLEFGSPNVIEVFADGAFEGSSGLIQLDTSNAGFKIATGEAFQVDLSTAGTAFLEMNYKNDIQIELGLIGVSPAGEESQLIEYILKEQEDWNKIYLNLSDLMRFLNEDHFAVIIQGVMPVGTNGELLIDSAQIWLDNIKLIHF